MNDQTQLNSRVVGAYGFGSGVGDGVYLGNQVTPADLRPDMKDKILLSTRIPTVHFMFKASAVGIAAVVTANNQLAAAEEMGNEISGKARIGFLLVSEEENLQRFEKVKLVVDGNKKILSC